MALRPIRLLGDDILRKKAKKVEKVNDFIRTILDDMADTMYKNDGLGLAGNQVGILKRLIVIDDGYGLLQLVNPTITEREGCVKKEEGCLSLPQTYGEVERAEAIKVNAQDRKGRKIEFEAKGILARIIQHEIDHLDGKLFIDSAENVYKANEKETAENEEKE